MSCCQEGEEQVFTQPHLDNKHNDVDKVMTIHGSLMIKETLFIDLQFQLMRVFAWATSEPSKRYLNLLLACIHKPLKLHLNECPYNAVSILLVEKHICQSSRSTGMVKHGFKILVSSSTWSLSFQSDYLSKALSPTHASRSMMTREAIAIVAKIW